MRVALIHPWLLFWRGAERVLRELLTLFPDSEIFTYFYDQNRCQSYLSGQPVHASVLDRIPGLRRRYTIAFPLFPLALASLCVPAGRFDLAISLEDGPVKGIRLPPGTPHLCYCHSPMRYAWNMTDVYAQFMPIALRPVFRLAMACMRRWDLTTKDAPHEYVANSRAVAERIRRYYGKSVVRVIHPPVRVNWFRQLIPARAHTSHDYYLVFGALISYKRIDIAIEAAQRLGRDLVIVGEGSEEKRLKKMAGPQVRFLGWVEDARLPDVLCRARALLFPGEEDFGIIPVEMMAAGIPVIAYNLGGALDTVLSHPTDIGRSTGIFFDQQTPEALMNAIIRFEQYEHLFQPDFLTAHAESFNAERFRREMQEVVDRVLMTAGRLPWFQRRSP